MTFIKNLSILTNDIYLKVEIKYLLSMKNEDSWEKATLKWIILNLEKKENEILGSYLWNITREKSSGLWPIELFHLGEHLKAMVEINCFQVIVFMLLDTISYYFRFQAENIYNSLFDYGNKTFMINRIPYTLSNNLFQYFIIYFWYLGRRKILRMFIINEKQIQKYWQINEIV